MRKKARKIVKFICSLLLAGGGAAISACAPSAEFQTVPQKGAWHGGAYPSFSARPRAETAQFSEADKLRLSRDLRSDGQKLRNTAAIEDKKQKTVPGAESSKKQANQEIEKTLRQITGK